MLAIMEEIKIGERKETKKERKKEIKKAKKTLYIGV